MDRDDAIGRRQDQTGRRRLADVHRDLMARGPHGVRLDTIKSGVEAVNRFGASKARSHTNHDFPFGRHGAGGRDGAGDLRVGAGHPTVSFQPFQLAFEAIDGHSFGGDVQAAAEDLGTREDRGADFGDLKSVR